MKKYKSKLDISQTQAAIGLIKQIFPQLLSQELHLTRVTAPLFVDPKTGLNDGLNGEVPVRFGFKGVQDMEVEIVHSLAKWKRHSLDHYKFKVGTGLYADMNAIRREEELDYKHSYYVDQWDWEKSISRSDRNEKYLKIIVKSIYRQMQRMEWRLKSEFDKLDIKLPKDITFITSQELADKYPDLTIEEREDKFAEQVGAFFVQQVGWKLKDGVAHGSRAYDYDDWNLNGDIIVYHPQSGKSLELSSMGIRVDREAVIKQSGKSAEEVKAVSPFHKALVEETITFSIGGGIGQSRLCMFLLEKAHIGEVQVSYWTEKEIVSAADKGIELL